MKLHHTKYKENYKDFILGCLDVDKKTSRAERVKYLLNRFTKECGFNIERLGKRKALADWLSGLAIPIPFYNGDIIELAKNMGSVDSELTTKQEDKIINSYWDFMADMILLLENEMKGETMTIYEIKRLTKKTAPHFFSRDTMQFFGQTLKDFKVYKQRDGRFKIVAPSGSDWSNDLQTIRFFNPLNNELEYK